MFLLLQIDTMTMATLIKEKNLFEAGLPVQRIHPLLLRREAWQCTGKHGTGERSESSLSASLGSRKRERDTRPGLSI